MTMFTNQTAEELEAMRCTSDGIFLAQNSVWMKINFVFVYSIILATFWMSWKAAKVLKNRNVYSNGSQILLLAGLLNANVNQLVFLEIRIRHLFHVLLNSNDPCQIEFHSPDCFYDQSVFSFTSILSTALVCSLTFDRFLVFFASSAHFQNSKCCSYLLIFLAIAVTFFVHFWTYGGVSRAGYVPSCHYPPQLSLNSFDDLNNAILIIILINSLLTIFILFINIHRDRKICQVVFDTKVRYNSFENVLTTKAICSITSTQLLFLSFASGSVNIIRFFEAGIAEEVFHITAQYVSGLYFCDLCIPILIYWQTRKCIDHRRKAINVLKSQNVHLDAHISSLQKIWENVN